MRLAPSLWRALVFDLEDAIAAAKTPGDMAKSDVRWRGRSSVPTLTQYSQAIPELLSWWRTPSRLENKTRHLSSVDILFLRFCIAHRSFPPCWLTPRWICIASACGMRLLRHCQQANNKSNVRFCRSYTPEEVCLHFFVEHLKSSGVLLLRCACGKEPGPMSEKLPTLLAELRGQGRRGRLMASTVQHIG